ncbi:MAG: cell division protein ZapA [Cellulosilyticaceae bacterium]
MSKNKVEVIIGGQTYSLQSDESHGHMKKVATLIDSQLSEIQKNVATRHLNPNQIQMLTTINIANEYLKSKEDLDSYINELEKCNSENLALLERIEEMQLEMTKLKIEKTHYRKK